VRGQTDGWDVALAKWQVDDASKPRIVCGNRESKGEWLLAYEDKTLLWIRYEADSGWIFDGELFDSHGNRICEIRRNVFRTHPKDVLDFSRTSNRLEWAGAYGVTLGVTLDGANNSLVITRLNMRYESLHVQITHEGEYLSFDGDEELSMVRVRSTPGFNLSVGITSGGKSKRSNGRVRDSFLGTVRGIENMH